jgi:hypothetical protein
MTRILTEVPDALLGQQIERAQHARGFALTLDTAEPWGGGRVAGRVEARERTRGSRPVIVSALCQAAWLDTAPQLVGQKRFGPMTFWDVRTRGVPIWVEEEVFLEREEIGDLASANWLHFELDLPPDVPRAFEGTFVAFRWRVEARRARRIGSELASLPLLVEEEHVHPVVRVETSPLGTWRLLEWSADGERDTHAGPCAVSYEERRPEDLPGPNETREDERRRRGLATSPPRP